jgi:hypothetical protein
MVKPITLRLGWQVNTKNNQLLLQSDWRFSSLNQPTSKRKTVQNVTGYLKTSCRKCQSKKLTLYLLPSRWSLTPHQTKIIERVWEKSMEYFCFQ